MAQSRYTPQESPTPPHPAHPLGCPKIVIAVIATIIVALLILVLAFSGVLPFSSVFPGYGSRSNGGASEKTYVVNFTEQGLPRGTQWSVTLNGTSESSIEASITFSVPEGTYNYSVPAVTGYSIRLNASGQVRVMANTPVVWVFFEVPPLGTAFSWGTPANETGVQTTGCTVGTPNAFCYSIAIEAASVTTANFILKLAIAFDGDIRPWPVPVPSVAAPSSSPGAESQICLVSPTTAAPVATYNTSSVGWTDAAGFSGSVTGGFAVVIYLVGTDTVETGLLGDELVAFGSNGYSGTVASLSFS